MVPMRWPEISPSLSLRPFQETFIAVAIAKAVRGDRVLVADVCPGSGKTVAFLAAAAVLKVRDIIDQVIIFAPRQNLAEQVEHSWRDLAPFVASGALGPIAHRENVLPMLRNKAWGYSSTYQAAIANPDLHHYSVRQGRTLLVLDEAQQLGVTAPGGEGTNSARIMARLSADATLTCLLSGTPYRTDGQPLLLASYGAADEMGHRPLLADVRATYADGVAEGYLRETEFHLHDGRVNWLEAAGGESTELELSRLERRIGRVIRAAGYWQPLVDRGVRQVLALQRDVDSRLCGLIAAADQDHARQIVAYLNSRYRSLRVLLATQDERGAQNNLRRFRDGEGDVLVSVAMCHMGYDHPPISVIVPLTTARADGWLRQLMARGQRMMPDLDRELQTCYGIVPDDPAMARFALGVRGDSVAGLQAREKREDAPEASRKVGIEEESAAPTPIGVAVGAVLTTVRAVGYDPDGDADPAAVLELGRLRDAHQITAAVPLTRLAALVRAIQAGTPGTGAPPPPPPATAARSGETVRDRERALRLLVSAAARACDGYMIGRDPSWQRGDSHRAAGAHFGMPIASCDEVQLRQRLAFVRALHQAAIDGDLAAQTWEPEPPAAD